MAAIRMRVSFGRMIAFAVLASLFIRVPAVAAEPAAIDLDAVAKAKAMAKAVAGALEEKSKFKPFAEVTKGAKKYDGLFDLYQKDDHLYAEIKPGQLDQPLLAPIAIARGMASAGQPLNFGDEWVIHFHRVGDKVQLIRKNIHYKAPDGHAAGEGGQAELHRLDPDGACRSSAKSARAAAS